MINGCICKEIIIQIPERTITYQQHSLFEKIKYSQNKPLQEEFDKKIIFFQQNKKKNLYLVFIFYNT